MTNHTAQVAPDCAYFTDATSAHRTLMLDFFPDARVMGEQPAYAFKPQASTKREWSSPISARSRAAS